MQYEHDLFAGLKQAVETDDIDQFRQLFSKLHAYDQAKYFFGRRKEERMNMYTYLSPEEMAELFENVEVDEQENYITEMEPSYAADMLAEMYTDDAVDVLNELEDDQVSSYLTLMEDDSAEEIRELLHYEEETAGSIMTTEFVSIQQGQTVAESMAILREKAPDAETIYYTYVVDQGKHLVGVVSLRDIIISQEHTLIKDIVNGRVVSVTAGTDQEAAAKLMKDYDFLALPVVDFQNHLLGIITVDDIVDVIDEEASEDYSKLAAVSDVGFDKSPLSAAKKRLPWLIILLFLGMMTASLIGRFEETLNKVAILAVFIPLIAGMAGNTGTQALAVVVRGLATGDFDDQSKFKLILRETGTGLITGASCGVLVTVVVYLWQGSLFLGLLVGFSLLCTLIVATLAGALVPMVMHKLNIDPAVASGPFITTINDIISILIYFGMATVFMSYLV